jgi:hypothetical protein
MAPSPRPNTLVDLLSIAADAIDADSNSGAEALDTLAQLRSINDGWVQGERERIAVDRLLAGIIDLVETR